MNLSSKRNSKRNYPTKHYKIHPNEWTVGVVALLALVYLRFQSFIEFNDSTGASWLDFLIRGIRINQQDLFEDDYLLTDVMIRLSRYCSIDMEMLCPTKWNLDSKCSPIYGDFLGRHLTLHDDECSPKEYRPEFLNSIRKVHGVENLDLDSKILLRIISLVLIDPPTSGMYMEGLHIHTFVPFNKNSDVSFFSVKELVSLFEYYLTEIIKVYGKDDRTDETSPASRGGIISRAWSRQEILNITKIVATQLESKEYGDLIAIAINNILIDHNVQNKLSDSVSLHRHLLAIDDGANEINRSIMYTRSFPGASVFRFDESIDKCMLSNFNENTLVTEICEKAIAQVPVKSEQLEILMPWSMQDLFWGQFVCLGYSILIVLMFLWCYFRLQKQNEWKMERKRRILEQELKDNFVRSYIEREAAEKVSNSDDREQLIPKLEETVQNWDSGKRASQLTLRRVWGLRYLVLLLIFFNSYLYIVVCTYHKASRTRCVETLILAVLVWTLTYAIPVPKYEDSVVISEKGLQKALLDDVMPEDMS
jgi:hypothetical protein